eukprot:2557309-Prymnesium_polylepis.1
MVIIYASEFKEWQAWVQEVKEGGLKPKFESMLAAAKQRLPVSMRPAQTLATRLRESEAHADAPAAL